MLRTGERKPPFDSRLTDHVSIGVLTRVFPPEHRSWLMGLSLRPVVGSGASGFCPPGWSSTTCWRWRCLLTALMRVTKEGSGGAAFYLIQSGEATVTVRDAPRTPLAAGDHFGEVALIDRKPRSATSTATTDLVCYGLTFWDFQPLV